MTIHYVIHLDSVNQSKRAIPGAIPWIQYQFFASGRVLEVHHRALARRLTQNPHAAAALDRCKRDGYALRGSGPSSNGWLRRF
jgi:hypothetical protein